ncbi:hypothetical protein D8M34_03810 [Microbacterium sp. HSID17254]|jgi:hypothetical protein|uniref:SMODS domain-containing nucleotidyltransferase n=1 Tax=Microbacterium sp. HSID17254 TaxID=2419509 RepID=UPI000F89D0DA|nr:hypothetical protein [Microbacterium sp. HSID17254]RUQ07505.1 hypothetical protein D8M34_03810 [Microbacterium sp. HSID17254]
MTVFESFTELQRIVDADPAIVATARERRDIFKSALLTAVDVHTVWGSGSLARSTQLQPVHDVDLVVEFDPGEHPEWGQPGDSAEQAIERCRDLVTEMLSVNRGTKAQLVRQVNTADRNRAAKCFIDDPGDKNAFTVDVMPALRLDNGILIPSKRNRRWDTANPRFLIDEVAAHQSEWALFRPLVRLLKYWSRQHEDQTGRVKSLVMEVLALECLEEASNRPTALKDFFERAAVHSLYIEDPAKLCGLIQPDLDTAGLRRALEDAADAAAQAVKAVADNDQPAATKHWQSLFGPAFPLVLPAGTESDPGPRPIRDSPQG